MARNRPKDRSAKVQIRTMDGWTRVGEKPAGGKNDAGIYGGLYRTEDGTLVFCKQEPNKLKNLAEFCGGTMKRALYADTPYKDTLAETFLAVRPREPGEPEIQLPDPDAENIYVCSRIIEDFVPLWEAAYRIYESDERFEALHSTHPPKPAPKSRPLMAGSLNKHPIHDVMQSGLIRGLAQHTNAAVTVNDRDIHGGNLGITNIKIHPDDFKSQEVYRLAGIDNAASFKDLTKVVNKNSKKFIPLVDPSNHVREIPTTTKTSDETTEDSERLANLDRNKLYHETIVPMVDQMAAYVSDKVLLAFTQRMISGAVQIQDSMVQTTKNYMRVFDHRLEYHRTLALENRISACFNTFPGETRFGIKYQDDMDKLVHLIKTNPDYFMDRLNGKEEFHFRVKAQKKQYAHLSEIIFKKTEEVLKVKRPNRIQWEIILPLACAGAGFLVGGPLGAGIGYAAGTLFLGVKSLYNWVKKSYFDKPIPPLPKRIASPKSKLEDEKVPETPNTGARTPSPTPSTSSSSSASRDLHKRFRSSSDEASSDEARGEVSEAESNSAPEGGSPKNREKKIDRSYLRSASGKRDKPGDVADNDLSEPFLDRSDPRNLFP